MPLDCCEDFKNWYLILLCTRVETYGNLAYLGEEKANCGGAQPRILFFSLRVFGSIKSKEIAS